MAKYISNRQKNLRVGISSYTENDTVLQVVGNVGVGTAVATTDLDVNGGVRVRGSLYDVNNESGIVGQILVSTGTGIDWTDPYSAGIQGVQGTQGVQGIQGTKGALNNWIRKTSTYTASVNDRIIADTSGGTFTINLPTSPSTGDEVHIADTNNFATTNLTIGRNGSTIEGYSDDFILDIAQLDIKFIYDSSTWKIFTSTAGSEFDFTV